MRSTRQPDRLPRILLAAVLLLLTALCSCGAGGQETPDTESVRASETQSDGAETEDITIMSDFTTFITNGFDKLTGGAELPSGGETTYTVYMAKNEAESCQIAIRSAKRRGSVGFRQTGGEAEGVSVDVFREALVSAGREDYPDPLVPFGGKLTLLRDTTTTLLLRFTSSKEARAGEHTYTFALGNEGEAPLVEYTIVVKIWDFALPDTPSSASAMGLYDSAIAKMHGASGEELRSLYRAYYDKLLEYKVSAYDLPYDILDDRADAYMSDARVTAFRVPDEADDEKLLAYYEKLRSNAVWLKKAYFYPLDEPTSKEMLDQLASLCERLHRLCLEIRICTPFFTNRDYDGKTDQIAFMTGKTTLWCPKSYMYITSNVYSEAQLKRYPPFGERMAERKAAGDGVWWYVCWEPGDPYCNLFVDQTGLQHRILFWQQYQNGVDGFLYWGSNYWMGTDDPWNDMATVKSLSESVFGDGSLLYNGNKADVYGACASLRLEAVRDGIEDFDLLKLASGLLGEDWVQEKIAQISTSLTRYIASSERFSALRAEIGDAVENALRK